MYSEGHGVPQDDAEAAKLFRLAAEQGFAQAYLLSA
jgi:TPR repeat protein